jgi:hypothetical protein
MSDGITIEGRDGTFGAYIARPNASPAPAVQRADKRISASTTAVTFGPRAV